MDPKNDNKLLQNAANIEYNAEHDRFDLVYMGREHQCTSAHAIPDNSAVKEPASLVARRNRAKPKLKEETVIDLSKYGDNPNPDLMTSPEKKKFREVLREQSNEAVRKVSKTINFVKSVRAQV